MTTRHAEYQLPEVRCINYHICETELSDWLRNGEKHKCTSCQQIFGKQLVPKRTCRISRCSGCQATGRRGISLPDCGHEVCLNCFRVGYLGSAPVLRDEPEFPDPDLEHEYFTDSSQGVFQNKTYRNYARDWEVWDQEVQQAFSLSRGTRECPGCS